MTPGTIFRLRLAALLWMQSLVSFPAVAQITPTADHHAHLQSPMAARILSRAESTGPPGQAGIPEVPSTASQLIAEMDAAHVRRSVALSDAYRLGAPSVPTHRQAALVDAENDWTLHQVELYHDRLLGFCSVNPMRAYALAAINHCARIGLKGGLKLHLANSRFDFEDEAQVRQLRRVFLAADRLRMPVLIHLRTGEVWHGRQNVLVFMNQVLPAASHIPVQIAHLGGWGGYDRATDETLGTFAEVCKAKPDRCNHLYFDISAVVLSPADEKAPLGSDERLLWDEQKDLADRSQRLAAQLRNIGLSRILFGTDWPNSTASEYGLTLRQGLKLSPAEIDQIFANVFPYLDH